MSNDDDGGNSQFSMVMILRPMTKYILLVTTFDPDVTGSYSIIVSGPSSVNISRYNVPIQAYSQYSSVLTNNSSMFAPAAYSKTTNYYYVAIEINVAKSDDYVIMSNSTIDTYGILYTTNFNPYAVNTNRQVVDDNSGGNNQFLLEARLKNSTKYILVVTTSNANTKGAFSVIGYGPSSINFSRFNVLNNLPIVLSEYSSSLTNRSQTYCRAFSSCSSGIYYYQSFPINVSITDYYSIWSNSNIDTYGFMYNNSFNASSVNATLLLSDDDSAGLAQFGITILLQAMNRYILVVTTYYSTETGSFSLIGLGPSSVTFINICK